MADTPQPGSRQELLDDLEFLGSGTAFADQIFSLVGRSQFFAEFNREDINLLTDYMHVYRARPVQKMFAVGDVGDYMLMIIDGEVDIYKTNLMGEEQHMTSVTPGMTLGEMSMIDGEPRFATCIAVRRTTFGVLSRDNMVKIILERPGVGAKILIKLVTMLSQRLRQTSAKLLQYMK